MFLDDFVIPRDPSVTNIHFKRENVACSLMGKIITSRIAFHLLVGAILVRKVITIGFIRLGESNTILYLFAQI